MKKLIFALLLFVSANAFSQATFYRIGLGVNAGLTTAYTGLTYGPSPVEGLVGFAPSKGLMTNKTRSFGGSLDYYFTPFIYGGINYNMVQLKDGTDKHNRAFVSDFTNIEIRGNVSVGQFIDFSYSPFLYAIRNVNAGLGIGFISGTNNVADYDPNLSVTDTNPFPRRMHAGDLGKSKFDGVVALPISIGYNLNLYNAYQEVKFVVGFQYKMVFTTSDDLDGYADDPKIFQNNAKDAYTSFGVSLKYLFGPSGLYFK
ncbi:hypothetical protein BCY91_10110 [Pelobium manganitolerans]|uniref:Outer membrane protein beta-barrel domain-containing protein n=1 Tax=Pelobium manganitolerans TaxID=1842495 RepID=A0A419S2G6_9SPHI|nr:hypothetical protein [Pelobium manganitolerans]RKD13171.1 hypothetical protein BCY91_10110 [Pelobium manganitolerans]